ncbi:hypothetical protein F511_26258 [Dorcoceras hygrometricum]|uniref:Uncharacterized protein n=1 Tax=Dorcoceras hygrometricum TaxID=472368 RepID=A0A2Z7CUQ5_9LAMI|nr:hypothetical protein F511_26258 [Dorcoceras hygrometricum]
MQHDIINAMKCIRQPITARWYSDTTNQSVTTPMIELDVSGMTHLSASHNMALNQVINQSFNQAQDVCIHQLLLTTEIISFPQRNQQQPSDVVFSKEHQNDAAPTNQNDTASLQQLTTDSFQNNQQLVALNNSKDVVKDTSPLLPTAEQKRYTQNAVFQLIKTTSPLISDWFLKPTAGHSAGIIPHNATADSATIHQSTPKS